MYNSCKSSLSMKCVFYEMSYLSYVLSIKGSWINVFLWNFLFIRCPISGFLPEQIWVRLPRRLCVNSATFCHYLQICHFCFILTCHKKPGRNPVLSMKCHNSVFVLWNTCLIYKYKYPCALSCKWSFFSFFKFVRILFKFLAVQFSFIYTGWPKCSDCAFYMYEMVFFFLNGLKVFPENDWIFVHIFSLNCLATLYM